MARVKLKIGDNEIEIDSRDFYVDNQSISEVITNLSQNMPENQARLVYDESPKPVIAEPAAGFGLESLDEAEAFEPEFSEPKLVPSSEVKSKLRILQTTKFFDSPRTVSQTVEQLREYGWAASPLDVSKALAKMASSKEIMKNSQESRTHYFVSENLITN